MDTNTSLFSFGESSSHQYSMFEIVGWYEWLGLIVAYITIGFVGICGNSFILLLFKRYKQLRKEDCVYLLAILAIADLIASVGVVIMAFAFIYRSLIRQQMSGIPRWQCLASSSVLAVGQFMDQIAMMCISRDRLRACKNPAAYLVGDHKGYAIKSFAAMCCFGIPAVFPAAYLGLDLTATPTMCTFGGAGHKVYAVIYSIWIAILVPTVLVQNIRMSFVVGAMMKQIGDLGEQNFGNRAGNKQVDVTKAVVMVVIAFTILSGMPNVLIIIATLLNVNQVVLGRVVLYMALGTSISAAINVFIYGAKHRKLRFYMIRCLTGTEPHTVKSVKKCGTPMVTCNKAPEK